MYTHMHVWIPAYNFRYAHSGLFTHMTTHVHIYACVCERVHTRAYVYSSGPSVTALTSWRELGAGPQVLSKLTVQ